MADVSKLSLNGISYNIKDAVSRAQISSLQSSVGSPLTASTASSMIDTSKVYVYTGDEQGYEQGNWYYYDGNDWVSGGIYNAVAVNIDKSLSVSDVAADSKTVGDQLGILKAGVLQDAAKDALLNCFAHVAWIDEHGQDYYTMLHDELYPSVVFLTATFNQSDNIIYDLNNLNILKEYLTVTATYYDGTRSEVNGYTLSGRLIAGVSTITVEYVGVTTEFYVNVTHSPSYLVVSYLSDYSTVYSDDPIDSLKPYLVVAYYADENATAVVLSESDYTLLGTLTGGISTITVDYLGLTQSFDVNVIGVDSYDYSGSLSQWQIGSDPSGSYVDDKLYFDQIAQFNWGRNCQSPKIAWDDVEGKYLRIRFSAYSPDWVGEISDQTPYNEIMIGAASYSGPYDATRLRIKDLIKTTLSSTEQTYEAKFYVDNDELVQIMNNGVRNYFGLYLYPATTNKVYITDSEMIEILPTAISAKLVDEHMTVIDSESLEDLRSNLIVTIYYGDGYSHAVSGYTLSGDFTDDINNVITVSYGDFSTTLNIAKAESTAFSGEYFGTSYDVSLADYDEGAAYYSGGAVGNMTYAANTGEHSPIHKAGGTSAPDVTLHPIPIPSSATKVIVDTKTLERRINIYKWDETALYGWVRISPEEWPTGRTEIDLSDYRQLGVPLYFALSCGAGSASADRSDWYLGYTSSYITVTYTQTGTIYADDSTVHTLDELKNNLVVTYYSDDQSNGEVISNDYYTLSGSLSAGTNTITVLYNGLTDTFNVPVESMYEHIDVAYAQTHLLYVDDNLDVLKRDLEVTYYDAGEVPGVVLSDSAYTLSGNLNGLGNTITVTYNGLTATFDVDAISIEPYNYSSDLADWYLSGTVVTYEDDQIYLHPENPNNWSCRAYDINGTPWSEVEGKMLRIRYSSYSPNWIGEFSDNTPYNQVAYGLSIYNSGNRLRYTDIANVVLTSTEQNIDSIYYADSYDTSGLASEPTFGGYVFAATPNEVYITDCKMQEISSYPVLPVSLKAYCDKTFIYVGETLDNLRKYIKVKVVYSDTSEFETQDYTLSGSVAAGLRAITVKHGLFTTTFNIQILTAEFNGQYFQANNSKDVTVARSPVRYFTDTAVGNSVYAATTGQHSSITRGNSSQQSGIVIYPFAIPTTATDIITETKTTSARINILRWNSGWECISPDNWRTGDQTLALASYRETYGDELYVLFSLGANAYTAPKTDWHFAYR